MPLAVRKVDHKALWTKEPDGPLAAWLPRGELQADALGDVATKQNRLSIYVIDDAAGVTVDRVVAAIAATRDYVTEFDYIAFDVDVLGPLGIKTLVCPGETPDEAVNRVHWDVIDLTAMKLTAFATAIHQGGKVVRRNGTDVGKLINQGLKVGQVDKDRVRPGLSAKLANPKYAV